MSAQSQVTSNRQWRLQTWLGIHPSKKPKVYQQVFATTEINDLSYWLEIFFSAGIATLGLVENSPAVIIGAMLISPLMGPIMATGLSLAAGDLYLGIKAVLNLVVSIIASIGFSALLVWLLPFHSATAEIIARTNPNLLDLGIALLSGLAGSVVLSRGEEGGVTALPGVAIAVALMPPLCTMGFGLGSGVDLVIMGGAGLLFLTNLVAIVATGFLVFLLVGMGAPEVEQAMHASRGNDPLARKLTYGALGRMLATGGQLRWRILMVAILVGAIAVPLRRALLQVAGETLARAAVQEELQPLGKSGHVVSQQVNLSPQQISIRLFSTQPIPDPQVTAIRDTLMRRTGRAVQISVDAVASKSELNELIERLARPAPPVAPKPQSFAEIQQHVLDQVRPAIQEIWPSGDAPIQDFDVVLAAAGPVVDVRYQAPADLGPVPLDMVQTSIRAKLGMPDLTLKAERIVPPTPTTKSAVKKSARRSLKPSR